MDYECVQSGKSEEPEVGGTREEPTNETLAAALRMAAKGTPVFPCRASSKKPLIAGGFKMATTEEAQIYSWWKKWPDAAIGLPTGTVTGLFVVDLDVKGGVNGKASLQNLETQHEQLRQTFRVRTPSGGEHLYFKMPDGVDIGCSIGKVGDGIDIKANGGYVIAPPSLLLDPTGRSSRLLREGGRR